MRNSILNAILAAVLLSVLLIAPQHAHLLYPSVPTTALLSAGWNQIETDTRSLATFAEAVQNGNSDEVVGVYAPGLLKLPVDQQPGGSAAYVTTDASKATQFALAQKYGSVGILAHNYLAGEEFYQFEPNHYAVVIYGDGRLEYFVITEIQSYQALTPTSIFSNFVSADDPSEELTAGELFRRIYAQEDRLVFQTCIAKPGSPSWGRMFVIAEPAESRVLPLLQQAQLRLTFPFSGIALSQ